MVSEKMIQAIDKEYKRRLPEDDLLIQEEQEKPIKFTSKELRKPLVKMSKVLNQLGHIELYTLESDIKKLLVKIDKEFSRRKGLTENARN